MQEAYVGDIGDFGKYSLLNALMGSDLQLAVVWYLSDEDGGNDGALTGYVGDEKRYRLYDPALFDKLRRMVLVDDDRRVASVRERGILPARTLFFEERLSFGNLAIDDRRVVRQKWLEGALHRARSADVIFLDPDNGLACQSARRFGKRGPKYVFEDELGEFLKLGKSVVVYQHSNRSPDGLQGQLNSEWFPLLKQLGRPIHWALTYHLGRARAYLICPSDQHEARSFLSGPWVKAFTGCFPRGRS